MTLQEIIQRKVDSLDSVPLAFITATEKAQRQMLKEALDIISQMEMVNGNIIASAKNFALIEKLGYTLSQSLSSFYYSDGLHTYAKEMIKQAATTEQYFSVAFAGEFEKSPELQIVLNNSIRQTLSLFDTDAVQAVFIEPLKAQLGAIITSGSSMGEAIQNATDYIAGTPELDGRLVRYVKQTAYDGFAITDRQYTAAIAQQLKAEWYLYEGGVLKDSREFCVIRHGHYYHEKEIEKWANEQWAGKRAGTNASTIFVFAGGYNCKHSILPVSAKIVPLADINRAIEKGYYKMAA